MPLEVYAGIRYQRQEAIGVGEGMNSHVYRAYCPYLQREIAVKEISKARLGNDFDSYCEEARQMFAVSDANIVPLEYVCETNDFIGLALPYYANGSLKGKIKHGPLTSRELMRMSQDVLSGLGRIHTARRLHLDLKPSNIFFDDSGRALIGDFGQARRISPSGTVTFPAIYKWAMPPEVWNTHAATHVSDIYQFGLLLYRAANGEPLYQQQKSAIADNTTLQSKILKGRFPDRHLFLPHVPKRVRTIIRAALQLEPDRRYQSAFEMASVLGRVPVQVNWLTQHNGGGAYSWRAKRIGKANLEVELTPAGSEWESRAWTNTPHGRRALGRKEYWKMSSSYTDALHHLTEVFADLNR